MNALFKVKSSIKRIPISDVRLFYCVNIKHSNVLTMFCSFNPVKLTKDVLCLFANIKKED